ncbi:cell surface glycoprotein CD200 receptor 1 isoform X2 [Talpa occidentalis]|uniref:cell surface glycoprotein CD200 receptor 1 isoform X2 n=1 Tax=Talpa occidentalis TaxID=50954 RepID=UPI00188DEE02|nr:cell surface glycoprotein CD200 receptor 1 isoform X2 [Talpa occidentalis]
MPCTWRTADLQLLLIVIVFVAECLSIQSNGTTAAHKLSEQQVNNCTLVTNSPMDTKKKSTLLAEVNTPELVQVDTKVVLSCPSVQSNCMVVLTWKISLRDKLTCTKAYRPDTEETVEGNCTDRRIIWADRPDQIYVLQIDPVSITHDGNYTCEVVTHEGNFHRGYHLQVLVPPEVTLLQNENRTTVCKAVAGKPAAQISWTPEGDCVTDKEPWDNGTVTVISTCHWAERNVSAVSCSVSHFTGNKSLSIELCRGRNAALCQLHREEQPTL